MEVFDSLISRKKNGDVASQPVHQGLVLDQSKELPTTKSLNSLEKRLQDNLLAPNGPGSASMSMTTNVPLDNGSSDSSVLHSLMSGWSLHWVERTMSMLKSAPNPPCLDSPSSSSTTSLSVQTPSPSYHFLRTMPKILNGSRLPPFEEEKEDEEENDGKEDDDEEKEEEKVGLRSES